MIKIIFTSLAIFVSFNSFAIPLIDAKNYQIEKLFVDINGLDDFDFEGIVKLSNCSGSLIIFENQSTSSKALILTNGHCIQKSWPWGGYLAHKEIYHNKKVSRDMWIYNTDRSRSLAVESDLILFASMTYTDIAIYRLTISYDEIFNEAQIRPFIISSTKPEVNTQIEIVSGYWDKGFLCSIEDFIYSLKEGDWLFKDSIRYSEYGCQVYGGTSGSPIIESGTRTVIGVNNTGNESGYKCTTNNPCEIDENGEITIIPKRGYGQQTYLLYSCLTPNFQIDFNKEGCLLYPAVEF